MRIFVDLSRDDVALMRHINRYVLKNGRSPKKREVIGCLEDDARALRSKRAFVRLVATAIISHSRNGHCWLTDKGQQALLAA